MSTNQRLSVIYALIAYIMFSVPAVLASSGGGGGAAPVAIEADAEVTGFAGDELAALVRGVRAAGFRCRTVSWAYDAGRAVELGCDDGAYQYRISAPGGRVVIEAR